MMYFRISFFFLASFLTLLVCHSFASAEEVLTLSGLNVDNRNDKVSVGCHIIAHDISALRKDLESGSVFELTCVGELYEKRAAMWNKLIGTGSYTCTISANPLAKECILEEDGRRHTVPFDSLKADLIKYWSGFSMPLAPWSMIERNNAYHVILKLKVVRKNIPQWVSTTLFFVNWELLPETIYELDFDY